MLLGLALEGVVGRILPGLDVDPVRDPEHEVAEQLPRRLEAASVSSSAEVIVEELNWTFM
ncbi:MAG: hypothetical protein IPJ41_13115 [Phycisphaerales bacterium]|nr:hypothetical protein [Phycisphaerales bacterium]